MTGVFQILVLLSQSTPRGQDKGFLQQPTKGHMGCCTWNQITPFSNINHEPFIQLLDLGSKKMQPDY